MWNRLRMLHLCLYIFFVICSRFCFGDVEKFAKYFINVNLFYSHVQSFCLGDVEMLANVTCLSFCWWWSRVTEEVFHYPVCIFRYCAVVVLDIGFFEFFCVAWTKDPCLEIYERLLVSWVYWRLDWSTFWRGQPRDWSTFKGGSAWRLVHFSNGVKPRYWSNFQEG